MATVAPARSVDDDDAVDPAHPRSPRRAERTCSETDDYGSPLSDLMLHGGLTPHCAAENVTHRGPWALVERDEID
ncbi:MAG: hypothetical protein ACO3JL_00130 [Myxococcota bacterium]